MEDQVAIAFLPDFLGRLALMLHGFGEYLLGSAGKSFHYNAESVVLCQPGVEQTRLEGVFAQLWGSRATPSGNAVKEFESTIRVFYEDFAC